MHPTVFFVESTMMLVVAAVVLAQAAINKQKHFKNNFGNRSPCEL